MSPSITNFFNQKITSNFFKKPFHIQRVISPILTFASARVPGHDPLGVPRSSPAGILAAPPLNNPRLPPELPLITNIWEFDTVPTEKPADPPPVSPGPNPGPEFPGPPSPSPPLPESPRPPLPSPPGEPEAFPPNGPDVIPPKPPERGPSQPIEPDVPPPFMGSDGLVFY